MSLRRQCSSESSRPYTTAVRAGFATVPPSRDSLTWRARDVRQGPDGALYVVTDEENGELWRIVPRR